jgi:hypothetical protein
MKIVTYRHKINSSNNNNDDDNNSNNNNNNNIQTISSLCISVARFEVLTAVLLRIRHLMQKFDACFCGFLFESAFIC